MHKKLLQVQVKNLLQSLKLIMKSLKLPNGLDVIFHVDRSDPVVAVSLTAQVGSAREK